MFGKKKEPEVIEVGNENLPDLISAFYTPAENIQVADDAIAPIDLYETLSQFAETNKIEIFQAMKSLNFKHTMVDGQMYWLVNEVR